MIGYPLPIAISSSGIKYFTPQGVETGKDVEKVGWQRVTGSWHTGYFLDCSAYMECYTKIHEMKGHLHTVHISCHKKYMCGSYKALNKAFSS